ncbi:MAG TPA: site-2 protease family protein [Anaerolineales bacterium]|jgi:membrane-associated protease RseP (regulator of RpoE activity)|nr:site-2 protease family protein [Anaerolineales bacterium]
MSYPEIDVLTSHVSRIFRVEDVTAGEPKEWIARYRGQLLNEPDSVHAYDQLADALRPYNITPLFRKEQGGKQLIYLMQSPAIPRFSSNWIINVVLFIVTFFSMMLMGVDIPPEAVSGGESSTIQLLFQNIFTGWPFAVSMMGILFAHEMGHYVMCRFYKVPATLPFFIPAPLISPLGTLGAFIAMRGIPKNKRVLFDVGVAGPLAGVVIAIPVLFLGLSLSHLGNIGPAAPGTSGLLEGNSIFYLFSKYLMFGRLLPEPASMGHLSPALYWLLYFFTGQPIPFNGLDVQLDPVALAGWAGLLVTALNLVPVGTLDGGHVAYGLFGEKARRIFPIAIGALLVLSFLPSLLTLSLGAFNFSWLLWVFILFWLGNVRTQPLDDITPLDGKRRALGFFMLVLFILLFTPIPMVSY